MKHYQFVILQGVIWVAPIPVGSWTFQAVAGGALLALGLYLMVKDELK